MAENILVIKNQPAKNQRLNQIKKFKKCKKKNKKNPVDTILRIYPKDNFLNVLKLLWRLLRNSFSGEINVK